MKATRLWSLWQAILLSLSMCVYTSTTFLCFLRALKLSQVERKMTAVSFAVGASQALSLVAINLIHPDVYGRKWRKEMKEYDSGKKMRIFYV